LDGLTWAKKKKKKKKRKDYPLQYHQFHYKPCHLGLASCILISGSYILQGLNLIYMYRLFGLTQSSSSMKWSISLIFHFLSSFTLFFFFLSSCSFSLLPNSVVHVFLFCFPSFSTYSFSCEAMLLLLCDYIDSGDMVYSTTFHELNDLFFV
jgi:hypothetical protein